MPAGNFPAHALFGISILVLLLLAIPVQSWAQSHEHPSYDNSKLALAASLGLKNVNVDSAGIPEVQAPDTLADIRHQRSALAAVLFSIVPGGGQIYNHSYWKVPIVWGVQAYFVYEWIANNKVYRSAQQELSDSIAAGDPYTSPNSSDPNFKSLKTLIGLRNTALDQRDSYAWYIAGAYLLSMLDAYVDAELSGFDVSPNLGSTPAGKTYALSFSMKF